MAIQMRRGEKKDFRPERLKVGEFAVPIDTGEVYIKTSENVTKALATLDGTGKLESMPTAEDVGAAPWNQVRTDINLNTLTDDGIYELQYSTFENMNVPTALQNAATFPAKFMMLTANIDGTYFQTIFSEWGSYIRSWDQSAAEDWTPLSWKDAVPLPIANGGTGATTAAAALTNLGVVDLVYPVGSIYMSVNSANPSTLFGGTWVSWGAGRVPVGINTSDSDFSTVEKTGGSKSMQSHSHDFTFANAYHAAGNEQIGNIIPSATSGSKNTSTAGSGDSGNLQPYITCYMWKRTA